MGLFFFGRAQVTPVVVVEFWVTVSVDSKLVLISVTVIVVLWFWVSLEAMLMNQKDCVFEWDPGIRGEDQQRGPL